MPTIVVPPGGNLTTAYNQAQPGDVIELLTGQYDIWNSPSGTKQITVRAGAGQAPRFRQIKCNAANITFDGLDLDYGGAKSIGAVFETGGNVNVTFKNGRIGNVTDEKGALAGGTGTPGLLLNTTFDNVLFHDVFQVGAGVHNEGLYSQASGLTVRNCTFRRCATMDLFITRGDWWGQPVYGDVTIENNVFEHSTLSGTGWHFYSLGINGGVIQEMRDWIVRNNTFEITASGGGTPAPGTIWHGNAGAWGNYPGAQYRYNVGSKIDATDTAVSPNQSTPQTPAPFGWVNSPASDFHLTAASVCRNKVPAGFHTATDRDGNLRPALADAGAYQFSASQGAELAIYFNNQLQRTLSVPFD